MKIIKIDSDLYTDKLKETPLGNFLSDFMRNYTNSDVAIVNSGVCRSMWQKGMVNGKMVEDMFPFEDTITTVLMTGKELIKTLETIQTGSNQIFEVSNLIQFMDRKKKKLLNVTFSDGSLIDENKEYKIAVTYFLLPNYGDEFNGIKSFYPHVKNLELHGDYTPIIFHHLQEMKEFNVKDYYNNEKLRMNFV
jgi:2',3'-cyclic-nucleotide 2'-phosphodiesterase (5'-nucleotidase family)